MELKLLTLFKAKKMRADRLRTIIAIYALKLINCISRESAGRVTILQMKLRTKLNANTKIRSFLGRLTTQYSKLLIIKNPNPQGHIK
jgi:hypothetical protein